MLYIKRLYSIPEEFTPIDFHKGVNVISGEKIEDSKNPQGKKTNGVGKSMTIEFIDFCLLARRSDSRVSFIPDDILPPNTKIFLDFEIDNTEITTIRTKKGKDKPILIINGKENSFETVEDATNYLSNLLFKKSKNSFPSFRQMLGPLIRDERSEFKDIIQCHDTEKRVPKDFTPHLYFFGIEIELYENSKKIQKEYDAVVESYKKIEKIITHNKTRKISDAKAELNDLNDEISKIDESINEFKSNQSYETHQADLARLQSTMDTLRPRQEALRIEIQKYRSLPRPEYISETDIAILYDQFRQGLGDIISKSLEQVKLFKEKIDNFQQSILNSKIQSLNTELEQITEKINGLDNEYSALLKLIDNKGAFKDVRNSLAVFNQKNEEANILRYRIHELESLEKEKANLQKKKTENINAIEEEKVTRRKTIESFQNTILEIHNFIMGNKKANFEIHTVNKAAKKEIMDFEFRISEDGSHSVNRMKVFIYDMALLFDAETKKRHPQVLIHDNIFDVDQDTFVKCLNYLARQEGSHTDFQYIFTLNRDRIENEELGKQIKLPISKRIVATLTKEKKFLYKHKTYQEL